MAGCWSTWQVAGRHSRSLVKMVTGQHGRQHPMTLSDSCRQQLALKKFGKLHNEPEQLEWQPLSPPQLWCHLQYELHHPPCMCKSSTASVGVMCTHRTHTHTHTRTCTRTHTNILHDTVTPPCAAWNIQACKSQAERTQCATRHPAITCHLLSTNT